MVTLRFTVEDIDTKLLTYNSIRVYRSDTLGGTYTVQGTITLVADTYYYSYDDATGNLNKWYKYTFYNAVGPVESASSDPFRVEGTTRLRIRQAALSRYGCGIVLINSGTDANKVTTADYRFKTSLFKANRGKGQWLLPTTGANLGVPRIISESDPTTGAFTVLPVWGAAMVNGVEVEWHTLVDPTIWADAINRGLARYWYVDIVPLVCVSGTYSYTLDELPWLTDPGQIHDVRYYPTGYTIDQSFAGDGRWWDAHKDGDSIVLTISPSIATGTTLYLECTRPMPLLYTDEASLPLVAKEDLAAALAYDEVLKFLSRPGSGTSEERTSRKMARVDLMPELRRLLRENRPKPRRSPARLPYPPVVPQPFSAR